MKPNKFMLEQMPRREWLLLISRILLTTFLAFCIVRLIRRSSCPDGSCSNCPEQGGCQRDEAFIFRQQIKSKHGKTER
jgi:hypothetical protein